MPADEEEDDSSDESASASDSEEAGARMRAKEREAERRARAAPDGPKGVARRRFATERRASAEPSGDGDGGKKKRKKKGESPEPDEVPLSWAERERAREAGKIEAREYFEKLEALEAALERGDDAAAAEAAALLLSRAHTIHAKRKVCKLLYGFPAEALELWATGHGGLALMRECFVEAARHPQPGEAQTAIVPGVRRGARRLALLALLARLASPFFEPLACSRTSAGAERELTARAPCVCMSPRCAQLQTVMRLHVSLDLWTESKMIGTIRKTLMNHGSAEARRADAPLCRPTHLVLSLVLCFPSTSARHRSLLASRGVVPRLLQPRDARCGRRRRRC